MVKHGLDPLLAILVLLHKEMVLRGQGHDLLLWVQEQIASPIRQMVLHGMLPSMEIRFLPKQMGSQVIRVSALLS
jgi:hypothetical protein